jgi:hypothetical protein
MTTFSGRFRCPVRNLYITRCDALSSRAFLRCGFYSSVCEDTRASTGFPAGGNFHHWLLGFRQCSFHHVDQPLHLLIDYASFVSQCFSTMLCSQNMVSHSANVDGLTGNLLDSCRSFKDQLPMDVQAAHKASCSTD